jgi:soluble lytic murein transglycosylase-like protein
MGAAARGSATFGIFLAAAFALAFAPAAANPAKSFDAAVRYEHGEGVPRDYAMAMRLYCAAAGEGDERASFNIAWMYLNGRGVARNEGQALAWLQRASTEGIPQARNLIRLFADTPPAKSARCPGNYAAGAVPEVPSEIRTAVASEAARAELDPNLVLSVMAAESAFQVRAISPKNAQGLMQLIPETAARYAVMDPFDMNQNIRGGVAYLSELMNLYHGDLDLTLAAYNAGENAVATHGGVPPYPETLGYVQRVKSIYGNSLKWFGTPAGRALDIRTAERLAAARAAGSGAVLPAPLMDSALLIDVSQLSGRKPTSLPSPWLRLEYP